MKKVVGYNESKDERESFYVINVREARRQSCKKIEKKTKDDARNTARLMA
ncbi:hypothetical protein Scep_010121 [Stephania cephalantha]|uniref:Uncharacterized protein n=1 Tax=Stephania cephalantha TaxID=152367 RepID=A0AAP0PGS2_9MAGN